MRWSCSAFRLRRLPWRARPDRRCTPAARDRRVLACTGFGSLGQQSGGYFGDGAVVPRFRRRLFVADELAVRVDAEPREQRPLQRVAEVLEGARRRLKPGPLPPAQGQAAAGRDDHQSDQRRSPTACSGHPYDGTARSSRRRPDEFVETCRCGPAVNRFVGRPAVRSPSGGRGEMAYAMALGAIARKSVRVRLPSPAHCCTEVCAGNC